MTKEETQGSESVSYNAFVGEYDYPLQKASFEEMEYVRKGEL